MKWYLVVIKLKKKKKAYQGLHLFYVNKADYDFELKNLVGSP